MMDAQGDDDETFFSLLFIDSLPDEYILYKQMIKNQPDTLKVFGRVHEYFRAKEAEFKREKMTRQISTQYIENRMNALQLKSDWVAPPAGHLREFERGRSQLRSLREEPQEERDTWKGRNQYEGWIRDSRKCYYCGKVGHIARNCRQKKRDERERGRSNKRERSSSRSRSRSRSRSGGRSGGRSVRFRDRSRSRSWSRSKSPDRRNSPFVPRDRVNAMSEKQSKRDHRHGGSDRREKDRE
jgi:Zinc knuckle